MARLLLFSHGLYFFGGILMKDLIVVAGLSCVDITPNITNSVCLSEELYPGNTISSTGMIVSAGGAVSNTGGALRKLGANVLLMYKTGNDYLGNLLNKLNDNTGCEISHSVSGRYSTSYSIILNAPGFDRLFIHDTGASNDFGPGDIDFDRIAEAKIFHLGYPTVMRPFYRDTGKELVTTFKTLQSMNIVTSMDMSVIGKGSPASKENWYEICKAVMPYTDIFVPSIEEISYMVDHDGYQRIRSLMGATGKQFTDLVEPEYVHQIADILIQWGAGIVLLKCGTRGMFLQTNNGERLRDIARSMGSSKAIDPNIKFNVPCFPASKVVSANGAGDVSIAGFLASILAGYPIKTCALISAAAGAKSVTTPDAYSSLPTLNNLIKELQSIWDDEGNRVQ